MAFVRTIEMFRTLLLSKPNITLLTLNRIYGPPGIPRAQASAMPIKAITLAQTGGTDNESIPLSRARIDMRCYGETHYQAGVLYTTVAEELGFMAAPIAGRRLQNQLIPYDGDNCYVYAVHKISGPYDMLEQQEEWPCVWASLSVLHFQMTPGSIP